MSDDERSRASGSGKRPVIRVQRRRRTDSGPEGRERAEAPRGEGRQQEEEGWSASSRAGEPGAQQPATRPTRTTTPTAGLPLPSCQGRSMIMILGLVAAVALVLYLSGAFGGDGDGATTTDFSSGFQSSVSPEPVEGLVTAVPSTPKATAKPYVAPTRSASASGQTWLVMLYQDADDKILEQDIYVDLNEAERVGSTDRVQIVAQVDRFYGAYAGDGDWTTTKRFYIARDDDLNQVRSEVVADLGEQNMSDPNTLVDFVTWAMRTYQADKYVLILSDHGMGWPGGWSDPAPSGRTDSSTPLAQALGDQMYLMELDGALQTIRDTTGLDKFELIGLDACLMGHLEVLSALEPHAAFAVLSQETEPALGWAYTSFLEALTEDPGMTGAELARLVVRSYVEEDQRIVDEQARAELMRQSSPLGGLFGYGTASAEDLTRQMGQNATLTAVDLSAVPALMDSVNDLSFALQQADQSQVAKARTYAQSFTSIFGQDVPPSYIDLGHFVKLLQQTRSGGTAVIQAGDAVLAALKGAVVFEKHGSGKAGASGVSLYFPNSQLFQSAVAGPRSYTVVAKRFAEASTWDDFLTFHYTGRSFQAAAHQAAIPESSAQVTVPGAAKIDVAPIRLSSTVASPDQPVVLRTDISGENIGYVLFFAGYYSQEQSRIWVADMDYLETEETGQIDGVYYPVWPEEPFTLEYPWDLLVFAIDDGTSKVTALFTPITYGGTPEEAVYAVDGTYTYASGGSYTARLYFRDGYLRQVYGFTGTEKASAPREIFPQAGDTFTVLNKWLVLDSQGRATGHVAEDGDTLTFGDQMFKMVDQWAPVGQYVVGFLVQDLDGASHEVYEQLTVE